MPRQCGLPFHAVPQRCRSPGICVRLSRSNRMLVQHVASGISMIGAARQNRSHRLAKRRPLVLAVKIVDDEKTAALEVLAQPLELLALRQPIAAAPAAAETTTDSRRGSRRRASSAGCRARPRYASCARPPGRKCASAWASRWPTTGCTGRATLRSLCAQYASRAMWNSASGGAPWLGSGASRPNCALANAAEQANRNAEQERLRAHLTRTLPLPPREFQAEPTPPSRATPRARGALGRCS